jgi:hypothetical protein
LIRNGRPNLTFSKIYGIIIIEKETIKERGGQNGKEAACPLPYL